MTKPFTAFLGDGERAFRLNSAQVTELERVTGSGIGLLFQKLTGRAFHLVDIAETIRLGLIGGGASPKAASELVETYIVDRPLNETYPLAVMILEHLWFGTVEQAVEDQAAPEAVE